MPGRRDRGCSYVIRKTTELTLRRRDVSLCRDPTSSVAAKHTSPLSVAPSYAKYALSQSAQRRTRENETKQDRRPSRGQSSRTRRMYRVLRVKLARSSVSQVIRRRMMMHRVVTNRSRENRGKKEKERNQDESRANHDATSRTLARSTGYRRNTPTGTRTALCVQYVRTIHYQHCRKYEQASDTNQDDDVPRTAAGFPQILR